MTITWYFHKVKSKCKEIPELDPQSQISETRLKDDHNSWSKTMNWDTLSALFSKKNNYPKLP